MGKPNIICISIDSLRMDYTSILGDSSYDTTPFLRSLASESEVFENAISPSIWTLPVHTSVFTGLYPPEHGVYTGNEQLGDHPTFAQLLAENGYSTAAFYKNAWLDTSGILRGFDTSDSEENAAQTPSLKSRVGEAIEDLSPKAETVIRELYNFQRLYRMWKFGSGTEEDLDMGGRATVDRAISNLKKTNSPFCWFIHLNDAHHKYAPPYPYQEEFTERGTLGLTYNYQRWQEEIYRSDKFANVISDDNDVPPREIETFKNLYRGAIKYCDSLIKELVESLKSENKWENTVLIVFGDHGDSFGEEGIFGHHFSLDDSLINVPLLVRIPDRNERNITSTPASLVDIYPTILQLTEISGPHTEGIDLLSETRDLSYTYYDVSGHNHYTDEYQKEVDEELLPPVKQYGVWKSENEKIIYYPERNTHREIGEGNKELFNILKSHTEQLEQIPTSNDEMSDDVATRLKKMGYLQE